MNNKIYHTFFSLANIPSLSKDVSLTTGAAASYISFVSGDKSVVGYVSISCSLLNVNTTRLNVINVDKLTRAFNNIKGEITLEYIVGELIVRSNTISYKHLLGSDTIIVATPKSEIMNTPACGAVINKEFVDIVKGICAANKNYDCVTFIRPTDFNGKVTLLFHNNQSEDLNYTISMDVVSEEEVVFADDLKITIDLKVFNTILSKIKNGIIMLRSELLVEIIHEKVLEESIEIVAKYYITSK